MIILRISNHIECFMRKVSRVVRTGTIHLQTRYIIDLSSQIITLKQHKSPHGCDKNVKSPFLVPLIVSAPTTILRKRFVLFSVVVLNDAASFPEIVSHQDFVHRISHTLTPKLVSLVMVEVL
jgi:hypothetical protein